MHAKNRILTILLALVMMLACLPAIPATADADEITWTVDTATFLAGSTGNALTLSIDNAVETYGLQGGLYFPEETLALLEESWSEEMTITTEESDYLYPDLTCSENHTELYAEDGSQIFWFVLSATEAVEPTAESGVFLSIDFDVPDADTVATLASTYDVESTETSTGTLYSFPVYWLEPGTDTWETTDEDGETTYGARDRYSYLDATMIELADDLTLVDGAIQILVEDTVTFSIDTVDAEPEETSLTCAITVENAIPASYIELYLSFPTETKNVISFESGSYDFVATGDNVDNVKFTYTKRSSSLDLKLQSDEEDAFTLEDGTCITFTVSVEDEETVCIVAEDNDLTLQTDAEGNTYYAFPITWSTENCAYTAYDAETDMEIDLDWENDIVTYDGAIYVYVDEDIEDTTTTTTTTEVEEDIETTSTTTVISETTTTAGVTEGTTTEATESTEAESTTSSVDDATETSTTTAESSQNTTVEDATESTESESTTTAALHETETSTTVEETVDSSTTTEEATESTESETTTAGVTSAEETEDVTTSGTDDTTTTAEAGDASTTTEAEALVTKYTTSTTTTGVTTTTSHTAVTVTTTATFEGVWALEEQTVSPEETEVTYTISVENAITSLGLQGRILFPESTSALLTDNWNDTPVTAGDLYDDLELTYTLTLDEENTYTLNFALLGDTADTPSDASTTALQLLFQIPDEDTVLEIAETYGLAAETAEDGTYYVAFPVSWAEADAEDTETLTDENGETTTTSSRVFSYLDENGVERFDDCVTLTDGSICVTLSEENAEALNESLSEAAETTTTTRPSASGLTTTSTTTTTARITRRTTTTTTTTAEDADTETTISAATTTTGEDNTTTTTAATMESYTLSLCMPDTEELYPGNTVTIEVETDYTGTLSWTSSDESVATVDSTGQVTFLAQGTVTITATGENGLSASITLEIDLLMGDVDFDTEITVNDAQMILQEYATMAGGGEATMFGITAYVADVNYDGEITITDATLTLQYYVIEAGGGVASWENLL